MIDSDHVLDVLFGKANALWRPETRHEAMLLMKALYKADVGVRERISNAILAGPPPQFLKEEGEEEKDWSIFRMLEFLESENIPLLPEANSKLAKLREQHPTWKAPKYPGLSIFEAPVSNESVSLDDIDSALPGTVAEKIIRAQEELGRSRRDLCEKIGVRIGRDAQWGLQVMDVLRVNIRELPADAINPILWGIRATVTDNTSKINGEEIRALFVKFLAMIEQMPTPSMWSSLPSLMQTLVAKFGLAVEFWNELAVKLGTIFKGFDYPREEDSQPIEWRQRAINHPYGDITELYLALAQQHVNSLAADGKTLGLEGNAEEFFSDTLAHYDIGSRYGLCLLAPWLSWFEAVSPPMGALLYPDFEWAAEEERPLVMWSGYLWANTLSRRLVQNFGSTYLRAAKHHSDLASQERRGLANHVSAVFWFNPGRTDLLCQLATAVDTELRIALIRSWRSHLENAKQDTAKIFFETVVFPYWDWCARQQFFTGDHGNNERVAFWELVPLSSVNFAEASCRAVQTRPSRAVEHLGLRVSDIVNGVTLQYPNQLIEFLIAFVDVDPHPRWQEKEWRNSWERLKGTAAQKLVDLENALARKGISLEGGT